MRHSIYNSDRPRCAWCDAPFRNQSDLIAHQLEHRGTAEQAAGALKQAADTGLTLQEAAARAKVIADDLMGIGTRHGSAGRAGAADADRGGREGGMTSHAFNFKLGKRNCWAEGHPLKMPSITLALRAGDGTFPSLDLSVTLSPAEARAMAIALEAAATHAENVLKTGLGESAVDAPAVAS